MRSIEEARPAAAGEPCRAVVAVDGEGAGLDPALSSQGLRLAGARHNAREFVKERMLEGSPWIGAFPALSICVRDAQKFEANGEGPDGELLFSASPSNIRVLSDGLGRVSALLGIELLRIPLRPSQRVVLCPIPRESNI